MQNLVTALRTVFPSLPENAFVPTLRLGECPNWDSMTAVNLLMEVEASCGGTLGEYQPSDTTTVEELATAVTEAGGKP